MNQRHDAADPPARPAHRPPIVIGSDTELGNFVLGIESRNGTGGIASRALLSEIAGIAPRTPTAPLCQCGTCHDRRPARGEAAGSDADKFSAGYDPQDWGRKFLPTNGGCVYIDLDHLELCTPEVVSAHDFVAAWHAMLRVARGALAAVNAQAADGVRVQVLVNNSDGQGHSYGGHLNFLVRRRTWDNLFHRRIHHMLFLAAHQVSSIVYTGQGKVGSEHDRPPVVFQLSQRADFFETLAGMQTTYRRPIVNSRDEPLCRPRPAVQAFQPDSGTSSTRAVSSPIRTPEQREDEWARLHVIFFDSSLCHGSCLLKVGTMQIILAMLKAGRLNPQLILDDPVEAVVAWSHDPDLKTRALMASGERLTAVELQLCFLDEARRFYESGGCEGTVPRAAEIIELWSDTLEKLRAGDFDALAGRIDWVLKRSILERAMTQRRGLSWNSPEVKHLDHLYSNLDPDMGLYWIYERAGRVERHVEPARIERLVEQPPPETRAWTRAMLLRRAGQEQVDFVDWDLLRFRLTTPRGWLTFPTATLATPLDASRADTAHLFESATSLEDILAAMEER